MNDRNFRNDVDASLTTATTILNSVDARDLQPGEQACLALAEAAVAIGYSLRRLAELAEDEADERRKAR